MPVYTQWAHPTSAAGRSGLGLSLSSSHHTHLSCDSYTAAQERLGGSRYNKTPHRHFTAALQAGCTVAASGWVGSVPEKGSLAARSQAGHVCWPNRITLITLLGNKYCYCSNTEKSLRLENQPLLLLYDPFYPLTSETAKSPFENSSAVLQMRNRKVQSLTGKKRRQ